MKIKGICGTIKNIFSFTLILDNLFSQYKYEIFLYFIQDKD